MDIQVTANPARNFRTAFSAGPAGTRNLEIDRMHSVTVSTIVLTLITRRALTPFITCPAVARIEIRLISSHQENAQPDKGLNINYDINCSPKGLAKTQRHPVTLTYGLVFLLTGSNFVFSLDVSTQAQSWWQRPHSA